MEEFQAPMKDVGVRQNPPTMLHRQPPILPICRAITMLKAQKSLCT